MDTVFDRAEKDKEDVKAYVDAELKDEVKGQPGWKEIVAAVVDSSGDSAT